MRSRLWIDEVPVHAELILKNLFEKWDWSGIAETGDQLRNEHRALFSSLDPAATA
jgi:hypothetical protein